MGSLDTVPSDARKKGRFDRISDPRHSVTVERESTVASVRTERIGSAFVVTIDRPERRNAVDRETAEALAAAFRSFEAGDAAVGVLTGTGGFCAGADLQAAGDPTLRNRLEPTGDGPMGVSRFVLDKPVIAAIEGHAVAGGLELALWCDLRVAAEDAALGVFCRRFGVPLIDGGTQRLPRLIGLSRALDLILTGRAVGANEALQMGLVNRVVRRGEALSAALELAEQLARFPQLCMRLDRRSAYEAFDRDEPAGLLAEFERGRLAFESEGLAGAAAFSKGAGRHGNEV